MQWLINNPVANMFGPLFLFLYISCLVGLVIYVRYLVGRSDTSVQKPRLPVPKSPDPYQLAYLRGGDTEVIRTAIVDLFAKRVIVEEKPNSGSTKLTASKPKKWVSDMEVASQLKLTSIQQVLLKFFMTARLPTAVYKAELKALIRDESRQWRQWIHDEELLTDTNEQSPVTQAVWMAVLAMEVLGIYKLIAAIANHHSNVIFLLILLVACPIVLLVASFRSRLTIRGKNYLSDVQGAYGAFKKLKEVENSPNAQQAFAGDASLPLLAMGLFGVTALQGSEMDHVYKSYRQATSTSNGGGFGCGASCGSGSSCGSGASCGGGGGCGGGGCGGCGGGS